MAMQRRRVLGAIGLGAIGLPTLARAATLAVTPQEELGPFYPVIRGLDQDFDLTRVKGRSGRAKGTVMELTGRLLRTDGSPVANGVLDVWQANAAGRYAHPFDTHDAPLDPDFQGSAKLRTGADGSFRIITIKPGSYPIGGGKMRTPHIHFDIATSDCRRTDQMYFPGEPLNATDLLRSAMASHDDDPELLTCKRVADGADGMLRFTWDIVLPKA